MGSDCYRMADFARDRLSKTYAIADETELKTIFNDACRAGELIDWRAEVAVAFLLTF